MHPAPGAQLPASLLALGLPESQRGQSKESRTDTSRLRLGQAAPPHQSLAGLRSVETSECNEKLLTFAPSACIRSFGTLQEQRALHLGEHLLQFLCKACGKARNCSQCFHDHQCISTENLNIFQPMPWPIAISGAYVGHSDTDSNVESKTPLPNPRKDREAAGCVLERHDLADLVRSQRSEGTKSVPRGRRRVKLKRAPRKVHKVRRDCPASPSPESCSLGQADSEEGELRCDVGH